MPPRGEPDWSNATPEMIATSSNFPLPRLWKRKFWTVSLATAISTRPSPSTSNGATQAPWPRGLQVGRPHLDARLLADVGELPVIVAQQAQSEPENDVGGPYARPSPVSWKPLDLIDLGGPGDVVADEQIEITVIVDIKERRAGEPAVGPPGIGSLGDVLEMSLAVVPEQMAAVNGRDVNVVVAVVVVITDGDPLAVEALVQPRLLGDVLEMPLAVVAVKGLGGRGLWSRVPARGTS